MPDQQKCTNCGESEFIPIFDAHDFDTGIEKFSLRRCAKCGIVHTAPILEEEKLGRYYKQVYYGKGNRKFSTLIEFWTIYSNLRLAKLIINNSHKYTPADGKHSRVLDIGCGRGNLLKAFSDLGYECHGVERTEFPNDVHDSSITIHRQSLSDIGFEDNYFDIVVLWHVLEHLPMPDGTIHEISRILSDSGILVIAVPNFGSFQSRIFRKHWFHLDLPRHLYHYERESLTDLLKRNRFKLYQLDTRSIDQSVFGFIQSTLNGIFRFSSNSFYEQLKLPWLQRKLSFYPQLLLGILISPLSLIDYFFSSLMRKGSCLIVTAGKRP